MLLMEYEHQYAFPPLIGPGKPRPLRRGFPLPGVDPGMGMFGPFPTRYSYKVAQIHGR